MAKITSETYFRGTSASDEVGREAHLLLERVNEFLFFVDPHKEWKMASGFRTPEANAKAKGATKSKHLSGQAIDIADYDKVLKAACLLYTSRLEALGLWCEDFRATPTWVHFQSVPPASGKRFFLPSREWITVPPYLPEAL